MKACRISKKQIIAWCLDCWNSLILTTRHQIWISFLQRETNAHFMPNCHHCPSDASNSFVLKYFNQLQLVQNSVSAMLTWTGCLSVPIYILESLYKIIVLECKVRLLLWSWTISISTSHCQFDHCLESSLQMFAVKSVSSLKTSFDVSKAFGAAANTSLWPFSH